MSERVKTEYLAINVASVLLYQKLRVTSHCIVTFRQYIPVLAKGYWKNEVYSVFCSLSALIKLVLRNIKWINIIILVCDLCMTRPFDKLNFERWRCLYGIAFRYCTDKSKARHSSKRNVMLMHLKFPAIVFKSCLVPLQFFYQTVNNLALIFLYFKLYKNNKFCTLEQLGT